MMPNFELSDQDAEILSAYIDNALSPSERAALEQRLKTEAGLRQELADLQRMVSALNAMPTLKAPRDFRLTPEQVGQTRIIRGGFNRFIGLGSAAAVFLLVIGAGVLLSNRPGDNVPSVASAPTQTAPAVATETPTLEGFPSDNAGEGVDNETVTPIAEAQDVPPPQQGDTALTPSVANIGEPAESTSDVEALPFNIDSAGGGAPQAILETSSADVQETSPTEEETADSAVSAFSSEMQDVMPTNEIADTALFAVESVSIIEETPIPTNDLARSMGSMPEETQALESESEMSGATMMSAPPPMPEGANARSVPAPTQNLLSAFVVLVLSVLRLFGLF